MIFRPRLVLVSACLSTCCFLLSDLRRVSAFAVSPQPRNHYSFMAKSRAVAPSTVVPNQSRNDTPTAATLLKSSSNSNSMDTRGGAKAATTADTAKPAKKMRITAFDSMRFVLCVMIVFGHFISFANPSTFWFKFFSQHNTVPVSAFFLLGGYVSAYTSTEQGVPEPSAKLVNTPKPQWILSRIFGYYPLHLVTLLLFSPMFIYTSLKYSGPWTTAWHGFLSATLTQAWFPMTAEVWNAPTWYLSALTFATAIMPYALPYIAKQDKKQLRKTAVWLWLTTTLPKFAYCHDLNVWRLAEGITSPKAHPNMALFNTQRFSPLYMVSEILLGAVACRLVMLDGAPVDDKDKKLSSPKVNALSTLVPLAALLGFMSVRAAGVLEVNDLLARAVVVIPLVLRLFMGVHRAAVQGAKDPLTSLLSNKVLVWLGNLAFPIYIVHGPIGQVFYKKAIATQLWGKVLKGPEFFALYLGVTAFSAFLLQKLFLQNKSVQSASKKTVDKLASWM
uniref:Acyltransferase 3 domain-containing protein n=1 Tax=Amphora coffeiformis TaxID=265554 RepID=A0A7S3PD55_9STRA|mmetsp:Transcript_4705/g.9476  ORF Transcript_4705/g.9476 Transcript_4705/m.9476 type:complete len:503 (+) Transcript_4705:111-1619(+)